MFSRWFFQRVLVPLVVGALRYDELRVEVVVYGRFRAAQAVSLPSVLSTLVSAPVSIESQPASSMVQLLFLSDMDVLLSPEDPLSVAV